MIVVAALTNVAPDMGHLPHLVAEVRDLEPSRGSHRRTTTTVSADAGYFSGENAAEDRDGLDF